MVNDCKVTFSLDKYSALCFYQCLVEEVGISLQKVYFDDVPKDDTSSQAWADGTEKIGATLTAGKVTEGLSGMDKFYVY